MSRRMPLAVGWTLAIAVIAVFCMLGVWQLGRGAQKQAMLDDVQQVLTERKAVALASADDASRSGDYDWAAGAGRFIEAPAVILDNQVRNSRPGVHAYRVFAPTAGAIPLLVDLGWLPLPGDRRLPVIAPLPDITQVSGLLAPPPSAGIATPGVTPMPGGTLLSIGLDHEVLASALELPTLAPRILKLDPDLPIGYARDLDILPNTLPPERHLGYAVQWFGLAIAVFITALVLTLRRRRR